jgi:hypothetical protein
VPAPDRIVLLEGRGSPRLRAGGAAGAWIDRLELQESGWWARTRSEHHHRHHTETSVRAALVAAGLECRSVHGTHTSGVIETPLDELHHAKAVYTARHRAP